MCTGATAGSRAWTVGKAMLAKDYQAHSVVFKCRPQWFQALVPQIPDILSTASSGWPLSLSGLLFYCFLDLSHLFFMCASQCKRNRFMYCALNITRKSNIKHIVRPIFLFSSVIRDKLIKRMNSTV